MAFSELVQMVSDSPESSKVNILLVDDNESNLVALEAILHGEDRNLVRSGSGDEALHFLLDSDAAVVLLDVRMPGISGLETAELIRGRKKTRDVPIIFLTAYDNPDARDLSTGYSLGAVDYIVKPFDTDALKSKVAVFVELYKKTEQVKHQASLLREKNIQLENANFERLGKLIGLGQLLTAERDPQRLLETFCDAALHILCAGYVRVHISGLDNESELVAHNPDQPAAIERETECSIDSGNSEPVQAAAPAHSELKGPQASESLFTIPVSLGERKLGHIYVLNKAGTGDFSEADKRLAMTLASQLAVAYENARLHAEAEAANRTKDEFLAVLSHELRTPLNAIVGWAGLMRNGLDSSRQTHALDTIVRNSKTLSRMVEDILDASRMITGKLRLEFVPCDLSLAVKGSVAAVEPTAEAKRIKLELRMPSQGAVIMGDPTRLQQIIWNLLSNAIKFTPENGLISVILNTDKSQASLYVIDSGQGITKEFLPFIFERFRQADATTTRASGGLGLGLSLVRHLVDLHGGTITAASQGPNLGSTFVVTLPLVAERT
jgi:signal transduction histidine kinase/CheY-like chemotaxis protein